ncbi:hypothetical protein PHMEG_00036093 [Phytophthora megakarya]|uniref:EF-hand domain-containing protein n=1 Tax=Phytophthora megakarya TaxID=4795 RepID=A0A225UMK5_9STRA|nr:hypothetical protein PHMEG_00036093 [Phytophthora megakarya]
MGITISQPLEGGERKDSPLAIAAVAEITQFTLVQLQALQAIWCSVEAEEEGDFASREPNLSSEEFEEALDSVTFAASDRAIFDRIFTLLDRTGDERVLALQFLISVLHCNLHRMLRGPLDVKLQAALQFASDADNSSGFECGLSPDGLTFALTTLTTIASFFGDPPLALEDVNRVVTDVYCSDECSSLDELVKSIDNHSIVQQYVYPS